MEKNLSNNINFRSIMLPMAWAMLFSSLFLGGSFLLSKTYTSSARIMPTNNEQLKGNLSGLIGQFGGSGLAAGLLGGESDVSKVDEAIVIASSHEFVWEFLQEAGYQKYIFPSKWNDTANSWQTEDPPTKNEIIKRFRDKVLTISKDPKTGIVTFSVSLKDRFVAAELNASFISKLNEEMRIREISEARASINYLMEQLGKYEEVGVKELVYDLMESKIKEEMLANIDQDFIFKVLDNPVVPDEDDYSKPNHILFAVAGFLMGVVGYLFFLAIRKVLIRKEK